MTEKLKKIIEEEIGKLPKENQEAVNAFDWIKITEEIGRKYLLSDTEINDFWVETLLVLAGLEDPNLFSNNVERYVGTSKDEAEKISKEAFQRIFGPLYDRIVENIKKNQKTKKGGAEQNLNFILSGGDYAAFVEPASNS